MTKQYRKRSTVSGAPRYTTGMLCRMVCVIEFARIIAAMWIFENMGSEMSDGTTSFIDQVILTYAIM